MGKGRARLYNLISLIFLTLSIITIVVVISLVIQG